MKDGRWAGLRVGRIVHVVIQNQEQKVSRCEWRGEVGAAAKDEHICFCYPPPFSLGCIQHS